MDHSSLSIRPFVCTVDLVVKHPLLDIRTFVLHCKWVTTDMVCVHLWPVGYISSNQGLPSVHGGVEVHEYNVCQFRMHSCELFPCSILVKRNPDLQLSSTQETVGKGVLKPVYYFVLSGVPATTDQGHNLTASSAWNCRMVVTDIHPSTSSSSLHLRRGFFFFRLLSTTTHFRRHRLTPSCRSSRLCLLRLGPSRPPLRDH